MKYPCELIKDLLPLYHDLICSEDTKAAVEEHFCECDACKGYYEKMRESDIIENASYDDDLEQKKADSIKSVKKKMKKSTIKVVVMALIGQALLSLVVGGLMIAFFAYGYYSAEVEVNTDISKYKQYMVGKEAKEEYATKWGMDETIFPKDITSDMDVRDYKMVYYNPFDAQYLGYLVVDYNEADYAAEVARLKDYKSTKYLGYYGVTGFDEKYTMLAMYADEYQGFVYALTNNEDTIIYVEIIFCNYFMDLKYQDYMPAEYFPTGFDATSGNAYEKEMMQKK